jgi:RNA polymerase sigma factor (sigma-70 family)
MITQSHLIFAEVFCAVSGGSSGSASEYLTALFRAGTLSSKSDSELLEQFISARSERDENAELAFSVLLQRHGAMVLRVCRGVLGNENRAEDAFQATFLVLASRARSIRRQVSVASWLYGVALRVAGTERSRAARRKRHERSHAMMNPPSIATAPPDDESARALHQEIGRLPERCRSAVVLCYLKGLTHEAAAERLGRPVGTVRSRLATARDRLKARLTRRGLAPAVIPPFVSSEGISTVLPAALEEATLRASIRVVVGKTSIAGVASAEAIALMEGTMKNMMIGRVVFAVTTVLAAGFVTVGAGVLVHAALARANNTAPVQTLDDGAVLRESVGQENAANQEAQRAPAPIANDQAALGKTPTKRPEPIFIQVEAIDSQGKPLAGAHVGVSVSYSPRRTRELSRMINSVSDEQGRATSTRVDVAPGEQAQAATIWAYKPGRALAWKGLALTGESPAPVRSTVEDPVNRTMTVVGHDGRPIEGARVVPRLLQIGGTRSAASIPEEWLQELGRITDEKGAVAITCVPRSMNMLTFNLVGAGIAQHTLEVPPPEGNDKYVIKLGRIGRLVGVVRNESGEPVVDVPVSVWVRASGTRLPAVGAPRGRRRATRTEAIGLERKLMRTGPEGAFRTPAALLGGMSYRVSIRHEGYAPFVSEWVELDGERTAVSAIRLRALTRLNGFVRDRQGGPVAGARVFLPSHGPSTTTDSLGHFELSGIEPEKTFVLALKAGFRFQGWPLDASVTSGEMRLTLARSNEPPEQVITPLPDPLPASELKALGARLLEQSLKSVLAGDDDFAKYMPLMSVMEFEHDRVREILNEGNIKNARIVEQLRGELAIKSAAQDATEARAEVAAVSDPRSKVHFLVRLAGALPKSAQDRKRALLGEAIVQARAMPAIPIKLSTLGPAIKELLDLGMLESARPLVAEGLKILNSRPIGNPTFASAFMDQAARLDPAEALARIQKMPNSGDRDMRYGKAAVAMATSHPAEAEKFFGLIEKRTGFVMYGTVVRLCRRLAEVDLPRAQRIAAGIETPGARACAWASTAIGVAAHDKAAALESLDRSLEAIDSILESGPGVEPSTNLDGTDALYPTDPAAVILPVVEQVAPKRLAEFFWRAVALHARVDRDDEDRLRQSAIGAEAMLLSRYNRDAAAVLFEPMNAYIQSVVAETSRSGELTSSVLTAKACLDPRAGVQLLELLSAVQTQSPAEGSNEARLLLAEAFSLPPELRWERLWRSNRAQLPPEVE